MNVEQGWIERFEVFARSKPAGETYDGIDSRACALAQFGIPNAFPGERGVTTAVYNAAVFPGHCTERPANFYTFGALADRLAAIVDPNKGDLEKEG